MKPFWIKKWHRLQWQPFNELPPRQLQQTPLQPLDDRLPADRGRDQKGLEQLLTGAFGRLMKNLELPPVRFHDLRHGHITHLLLRGVPFKVASVRVGHSGAAITADLYGRLLPGADEQAAAKMDDAYWPKPRAAVDGS